MFSLIGFFVVVGIIACGVWWLLSGKNNKIRRGWKNVARDKREQLGDAMADPVRDNKWAVRDANEEIEKFRQEVADLGVFIKDNERKRDAAIAEVTKYTNLSEKAAAAGDAEGVGKLIKHKQKFEGKVTQLNASIGSRKQRYENLKSQIEAAQSKVDDAAENQEELEARFAGAKVEARLAAAESNLSGGEGLAGIQEFAATVQEMEDHAAVVADLHSVDSELGSLEDKYGSSTDTVDDETAALLARFKK